MDVALIVIITGVIAGGVLGGVLRGWSVGSRIHNSEVRLAALEGQVLRLTKQNAAAERWNPKRDKVADDAKELLAAAGKTESKYANGEGVRWW